MKLNYKSQTKILPIFLVFLVLIGSFVVYLVTAQGSSFNPEDNRTIGYEFLNDGKVFHMWNTQDDYFFNKSSGIQFTNHYEDYWSKNVFCIGYYNNGIWHKIKCADELNNFKKDVQTDNLTYVNATLWKDIAYEGYDLRLGVRYHLNLNDEKLSVTIYGKNIGSNIPYDLGFAWKVTNVEIPDSNGKTQPYGDSIEINNTRYKLNNTFNLLFKNMSHSYFNEDLNKTGVQYDSHFRLQDWTEYLRIDWNHNLNYAVKMYGNGIQEDFYVALLINAGHFNPNQEKSTTIYWIDAEGDYIRVFSSVPCDDVRGITTNSTLMWTTDITGEICKHSMDGTYIESVNSGGDHEDSSGMGNDGTYFWIACRCASSSPSMYQYYMNGTYVNVYALDSSNTVPLGVTTDGDHIWVGDPTADLIFKYDMSMNYVSSWAPHVNNADLRAVKIYENNYWIPDDTGDLVFKYDLSGNYVSNWSLNVENADCRGIEVTDGYIWVTDYADNKVYEYEGPPDLTKPTYSSAQTNTTIAGAAVNFSILYADNLALDTSGQWIFSTNNTGTWINETTCIGTLDCTQYSTQASCINCSECVWSAGSPAQYEIFFEGMESTDWVRTSNNAPADIDCSKVGNFNGCSNNGGDYEAGADSGSAQSGTYGLTMENWDNWNTQKSTTGIWYTFDPTTACDGGPCEYINLTWWWHDGGEYDNNGEYMEIIANDSDQTDVLIKRCDGNSGGAILCPTSYVSKQEVNLSASLDDTDTLWTIRFGQQNTGTAEEARWDNINITGYYTPSSCSNDGACSSCAINECATNCSTAGCYETGVNFTATPQWANVTDVLNSTEGTVIGYRWFADDNAGNVNNTEIYIVTTTSVGDTCTYTSGNWIVDCSDDCSITSNVNVGDNNIIVSGVGSFYVLANITAKSIAWTPNCRIINVPNDGAELRIEGG